MKFFSKVRNKKFAIRYKVQRGGVVLGKKMKFNNFRKEKWKSER